MLGHGTGVVEKFAAGLQFGKCRAGNGDENHAADGAFAGMVVLDRDVLGHGADVLDGGRRERVGCVE